MMNGWRVPLMLLTLINRSVGTICGRSALTAGIWMPAPTDRMADTRKISHSSW